MAGSYHGVMKIPAPGESIGPYQIERVLGRGGFGVVYEATRDGQSVALKLMRPPEAQDKETPVKRFRREASLVQRIDHPNVVRFHDFGDFDGMLYCAMELLDGEDLHDRLAGDGRVEAKVALQIALDVLDALGATHSEGIIHRDIKPANIFIEASGDVKVLDYGIAAMPDADNETLTQAGTILGTPKYMPPETILGAEYFPASDVYALGLVVFEMLRGAPAFDGETFEILRAQVLKDPPIPETALLMPLGRWLYRALQKDPRDRFEDGAAAAKALRDAMIDVESFEETWHDDTRVEVSETLQVVLRAADRTALSRLFAAGEPDDASLIVTVSEVVVVRPDGSWVADDYSDTFPTEDGQPAQRRVNLQALRADESNETEAAVGPGGASDDLTPPPRPAVLPDFSPVSDQSTELEPLSPSEVRSIDIDPGGVQVSQRSTELPALSAEEIRAIDGVLDSDESLPDGLGRSGHRDDASEFERPGVQPRREPSVGPRSPELVTDDGSQTGGGDTRSGAMSPLVVAALGLIALAVALPPVLRLTGTAADQDEHDSSGHRFRIESTPTGASFGIDARISGVTPRVVEVDAASFPLVIAFRHPNGSSLTKVVKHPVKLVSVVMPPPPTREEPEKEEEPRYVEEAEEVETTVRRSASFDVAEVAEALSRPVNKEIVLQGGFDPNAPPSPKEPPVSTNAWRGDLQEQVTEVARTCMPPERYGTVHSADGEPSPLLAPYVLQARLAFRPSGRIHRVELEEVEGAPAPDPEVRECIAEKLDQRRFGPLPSIEGREEAVPVLL